MATSSVSGSQGLSGGIWAQLQQQQVQRVADQAEQKARALRAQAGQAQGEADRAQENARSLKVQSQQAQGDAANARMSLASMQSIDAARSQFGEWRAQLATALESGSAPVASVAATSTAQPVLNAEGQTTGSLISITA